MHTPTIWTIVTTRNTQSSVSNAEANHEKLIQAQTIAKTPIAKAINPVQVWPSKTLCAKRFAAWPTATTKVRSNSSSNGVEARPRSRGSRPAIRRMGWAREGASLMWTSCQRGHGAGSARHPSSECERHGEMDITGAHDVTAPVALEDDPSDP